MTFGPLAFKFGRGASGAATALVGSDKLGSITKEGTCEASRRLEEIPGKQCQARMLLSIDLISAASMLLRH